MATKIEVKTNNNKSSPKEIGFNRDSQFSLFQNIDNYFDEMTRYFFNDWNFPTRSWVVPKLGNHPIFRTPLSNIEETEKNFILKSELPGISKSDIKIESYENLLEISAERKSEMKEDHIRREFHSSNYFRRFHLPENINKDKISSTFENGILTIVIPKMAIIKDKREIEIK